MAEIKQLLPREAYFDGKWFEEEKRHIFEKEWQFVCMRDALNNEGDFVLETVGDSPAVVLQHEGEAVAFHNMCRHRGMQLLNGKEKPGSSIVCPYHNWNYGLDGTLKGVPQSKSFPDMEKKCMGLVPVRCEVWEGMVFVNLDGDAPSLAATLEPLRARILPYLDMDELEHNDGYRYVINANWKIFVENYMDIYHLFHIHKESLKEYDHKAATSEFVNDHWLFYEPLSDKGEKNSKWWDMYMSSISSFEGERGAYVSMLFPNFGITATENLCLFLKIKPLSGEETEITVYAKSNSGVSKPKQPLVYDYRKGDKPVEKLLASPDVMNEDIYACEMIQKNMRSKRFEVGALAEDYEKTLYDYQSIILRKLARQE
jgi:Rieske 2Fe-2S family protein